MDVFQTIDWAVFAPLLVVQGILLIVAVIDWARRDTTTGPKWMWLPIILFVSIVGPILYFIFGRKDEE